VSRLVAAALCASLAIGCGAHARRNAELAIGGSLAGVLATSLVIAAAPSTKPESIGVAIAFGALAIASTVAYGIAVGTEPEAVAEAPRAAPPDHRAEAWSLTQQAQAAARANDCGTVRGLSEQVAQLDASFHTAVFARDVAVAACLRAGEAEH